MICSLRRATIYDLPAHKAAHSLFNWAVLRQMHRDGLSWVLEHEGDIIALGGVYPIAVDCGEVWLSADDRAAPHLHSLLRLARLTLESLPYDFLMIPQPNDAGAVMARRLGFEKNDGNIWIKERRHA